MNTEPKRRGRPKGSNSFANLTLAELNERFKQDDLIPVGRLFLEKSPLAPQRISDSAGVEMKTTVSNHVFIAPATEPTSMVEMTLSE